jgi:hypothetical protein
MIKTALIVDLYPLNPLLQSHIHYDVVWLERAIRKSFELSRCFCYKPTTDN